VKTFLSLAASLTMLGACLEAPNTTTGDGTSQSAIQSELMPNGRHGGTSHDAGGGGSTQPISYHNGPVIEGTVNVYFIWYGDWSYDGQASAILGNLATNIGGTPYYNINTKYYDVAGGLKHFVSGNVVFGGQTSVSYTYGTSLDDNTVFQVVDDAVSAGALPQDTNGVYFVLTSRDVKESSGFCSQYCGWHFFGTIAGSRLKYSFIGNPDQCPSACSAQTTSPNGNVGADGMASIISHELEEAVTDPYVSAWTDSSGEENADKCAWTFGTEQSAANGSQFNVTLNGMQYLIQQNWVNANGGSCAMSL